MLMVDSHDWKLVVLNWFPEYLPCAYDSPVEIK